MEYLVVDSADPDSLLDVQVDLPSKHLDVKLWTCSGTSLSPSFLRREWYPFMPHGLS